VAGTHIPWANGVVGTVLRRLYPWRGAKENKLVGISERYAGKWKSMRKRDVGTGGFRTAEEWVTIAAQVASETERKFNRHSGPTRTQSLLIIGFLVLGIIFALTALLFPQAVHFQGPANGWLSAHRFAEGALAIALNAIWWGVRIRLSHSAAWRSKAEIERLKLK